MCCTQESISVCACVYVCVCVPPGNDIKYSAIVKAFERNSRDYLFTRRPFPIFILLQPSPSSSFFLSPVLGLLVAKKYVAFLTIRPLRRVSVSALQGFKVTLPAMDSSPFTSFSFPFFLFFIVSRVTRGKLSLIPSRMIKLFYSFPSIFFCFLFFFHEKRSRRRVYMYYISEKKKRFSSALIFDDVDDYSRLKN